MPDQNPADGFTLELLSTFYTVEQLLSHTRDLPQIAFAGRSNVGKSSLINALARRRKLAKVSSEPGKTRSVNLYKVMPDGFVLTDLPGYGYARRGHQERKNWAVLIQKYLEKTPSLRALALLVDCRVPLQDSDRIMAEFALVRGLPLIVALTKADKCSLKERSAQQALWTRLNNGRVPLLVSSLTGMGMEEMRTALREAALNAGQEECSMPGTDAGETHA